MAIRTDNNLGSCTFSAASASAASAGSSGSAGLAPVLPTAPNIVTQLFQAKCAELDTEHQHSIAAMTLKKTHKDQLERRTADLTAQLGRADQQLTTLNAEKSSLLFQERDAEYNSNLAKSTSASENDTLLAEVDAYFKKHLTFQTQQKPWDKKETQELMNANRVTLLKPHESAVATIKAKSQANAAQIVGIEATIKKLKDDKDRLSESLKTVLAEFSAVAAQMLRKQYELHVFSAAEKIFSQQSENSDQGVLQTAHGYLQSKQVEWTQKVEAFHKNNALAVQSLEKAIEQTKSTLSTFNAQSDDLLVGVYTEALTKTQERLKTIIAQKSKLESEKTEIDKAVTQLASKLLVPAPRQNRPELSPASQPKPTGSIARKRKTIEPHPESVGANGTAAAATASPKTNGAGSPAPSAEVQAPKTKKAKTQNKAKPMGQPVVEIATGARCTAGDADVGTPQATLTRASTWATAAAKKK